MWMQTFYHCVSPAFDLGKCHAHKSTRYIFVCNLYRLMKYHESIQANLLVSPRRCRRGFHLLEDEAANFPLSEDLEISHPEITFDTFFKRVTGPNREVPNNQSKSDGTIFQVIIYWVVNWNNTQNVFN